MSSRSSDLEIFVPGIGQYDNIGDIILRRPLLDWLRDSGRLHVYVGNSPMGYDGGLRLQPSDVVYRSFRSWYFAAIRSSVTRRTAYFFKPGEIQLTLAGMKEHVAMVPLLLLLRAKGFRSARIGSGTKNDSRLYSKIVRSIVRLSNLSLWRTRSTFSQLGGDGVMPDLAFGEGSGTELGNGARDSLIVSMRSDRADPTAAWFDAITSIAESRGLKIVTVTQVHRDESKSALLAKKLGGSHVGWDGTDHSSQEKLLREHYSRAVMVVSDRLHVLVAALTEGAIPIALLVDESAKISSHFEAASLPTVTISSREKTAEQIVVEVLSIEDKRELFDTGLAQSRRDLDVVRQRANMLLRQPTPSKKRRRFS